MSKQLPQTPDFPKLEEEIMKFWKKNNIVERYLSKNATAKKRFSFLDGPITANNPMGVHHGWGRTYKDLWQRFFTMQGYSQRYQNGFDAQGLWVEVEVEKELGFRSKKDIEQYGIDRFIDRCMQRVEKYAAIQTEQSKRLGYFMDWEHSYFTSSDANNYSIWQFLKHCHERGLIYKGHDSVPWCPRCGTAISQHEILTEEYHELTHTSLFIKYPVTGQPKTFLLVWTTTPWTLAGNVAIAVGRDIEYVRVKTSDGEYIVAKDRLNEVPNLSPIKITSIGRGGQLTSLTYGGLFDDLPRVKEAMGNRVHQVLLADFVTLTEGTGLVHVAPGAGAEDYRLASEQALPVIDLIEEDAVYKDGLGHLTGQNAAQNPDLIIAELKNTDQIASIWPYTHRYPTCWRCKTELVFRLVDEWYIKMDPIRADIIAIARQINWLPTWGLDRELDWLQNMQDWLISKKRYWGLALPIYDCQKCHQVTVIGSLKELKDRAVAGWEKFSGHSPHRPWIDEVKIQCDCGTLVSRIPDVGNPWLDAGIVPFSTLTEVGQASVSYFDDPLKTVWRQWFPADFITESLPGQFRNWFYALLAMSTVLENRPPFQTVLGHGSVRDEHGEEMHKSKGNAIEFNEAADRVGADAMRWLYLTANPESNVNFGFSLTDEIKRRFILILWHTVNFYLTYSTVNAFQPRQHDFGSSASVIDEWIKARYSQTANEASQLLLKFNAMGAARSLEFLVVEDLSKWYVRRNRKRTDAGFFQTLDYCLISTLKMLAPFIPFVTEFLYQRLKLVDDPVSIHLTDWPDFDRSLINVELCSQMDTVRLMVNAALAERSRVGLKIRQPLAKLSATIATPLDQAFIDILAEEVNVKQVDLTISPNALRPSVELDTQITDQLKQEGLKRELTHLIAMLRKEAGYRVGESIECQWRADNQDARQLFSQFTKAVSQDTLVKFIEVTADFDRQHQVSASLAGLTFGLAVRRKNVSQ